MTKLKSGTKDHEGNKCCEIDVDINNEGTVNIYNCLSIQPEQPPDQEEPPECPPTLPPTGGCVPLALGSKPKKSLEAKLRPLLENNKVPSVLAGSFFQMGRRFLRGRDPANSLESAVFDVFRGLSPTLRDILTCSLQTFDALNPTDRDRLFVSEFTSGGDQPVDPERLAELVANELVQRASLEVFDDLDCIIGERPGQVRLVGSGDVAAIPVTICRVNGLRTNTFSPSLSLGEYTPDELQQQCTPEVVDDQVQLNCEVQTEDCPGNAVEGTCLRVSNVNPGDAVILKGVNFFNVEAKVRIVAKPPGQTTREVETHVCGDITTPVTEIVDGSERTIADCRVQDTLTFRVPDDLPVGIYGITVIVPNNTGLPGFGDEIQSNSVQFVNVVPPESATFQIASETLHAVKETSPASFGSDEVGIRIVTIPVALDLTPGELVEHKFEFGDVDSDESRDMSRVLFQGSNLAGVSVTIIGFEIDSRDAFENQIQTFTDAYVDILKKEWEFIAAAVAAAGGIGALKGLGLKGIIIIAIALAIVLVINIFVALWAPADLLIEDAAAFTTLDLAALTSPNFPPPAVIEFTSAGDIEVKIESVSKGAAQYTERREYISDDEDSEYHIILRYNRLS